VKLRPDILIALVLAAAAGTYFAMGSAIPAESGAAASVKKVRVAAVENASDPRELRFSGVTRAAQRARLSFSLGARLAGRPVEVGDQVKRGQVLARLDDSEVKNGLATARATLAEAQARRGQLERDVERVEKLHAAKAATAEELEKTRTGLESLVAASDAAGARVREVERLVGETSLRAPYDGTITEVLAEPGEFVGPGRPILILSGEGDTEVQLEVPESLLGQLQPGAPVPVKVSMLGGRSVTGQIRSLGRSAAGPGQLFPVVVSLDPAAGVPAGATAELAFRVGDSATLSVPVGAVVDPGGRRPAVFRIEKGTSGEVVRKVQVELGSLVGGRVTVRGSLAAGDRVVVGGQRGLLDGDGVEVEP
jgi:RND family efflux transporter MFP subunit